MPLLRSFGTVSRGFYKRGAPMELSDGADPRSPSQRTKRTQGPNSALSYEFKVEDEAVCSRGAEIPTYGTPSAGGFQLLRLPGVRALLICAREFPVWI